MYVYNIMSCTINKLPVKSMHHPDKVNGIPWGNFERDTMREASFLFYPDSAVKSVNDLVDAGFVYTGDGTNDEVICYFCHAKKKNWTPDEKIENVHNPGCPMVAASAFNNTVNAATTSATQFVRSSLTGPATTNERQCTTTAAENYNLVYNTQQYHLPGFSQASRTVQSQNSFQNGRGAQQYYQPGLISQVSSASTDQRPSGAGITQPSATHCTTWATKSFGTHPDHLPNVHFQASTAAESHNISHSTQNAHHDHLPYVHFQASTTAKSHNISHSNQNAHRDHQPNLAFQASSASISQRPSRTDISQPSANSSNNLSTKSSSVYQDHQHSFICQASPTPADQRPSSAGITQPTAEPRTTRTTKSSSALKDNQPTLAFQISSSPSDQRPNAGTTQPPAESNTTSTTKNSGTYENKSHIPKQLTYQDLAIITGKPKYPQYAVLASRIESFHDWPNHCPVKSEDIAKAGMFHRPDSTRDRCQCFFCGRVLKSWEPGDDPFVEHARWYPQCDYIRECMGNDFVNAVQELKNGSEKVTHDRVKQLMLSKGMLLEKEFDEMSIADDAAVRSLVDEGFDKEAVCKAAREILNDGDRLSADVILAKLSEADRERGHTVSDASFEVNDDTTHTSEEVKELKEQNYSLRGNLTCKICMDKEVKIVFLPCGHLVSCAECAAALTNCPVCRKHIRASVRANTRS